VIHVQKKQEGSRPAFSLCCVGLYRQKICAHDPCT